MTWHVELWGGPMDGEQMEVPPEYNGAPPDMIKIAMQLPSNVHMLPLPDLDPDLMELPPVGIYRLRLDWNELLPIYDWMPYEASSLAG